MAECRMARIALATGQPRCVQVSSDTLLPYEGAMQYQEGAFTWLPAVTGTVYGTLLNFKGALAALGERVNAAPYQAPPKAPILYLKPANTHAAHLAAVSLPSDGDAVEIGASLGIVFGRQATRVSAANALGHVAGYTIVCDVSVAHASYYRPAIRQRCRDGYCPIGPWVMGRSAVANPDALSITVRINGEVRQHNHTSNLIRPVAQLIADVTAFMTLYPGDVLLAGVPEDAPLARAGDMVDVEIEQVGVLRHAVVAAPPAP